jgi:hypothetical protein
MTKILKNQLIDEVLIIWTLINWNLFGAWDLVIGI